MDRMKWRGILWMLAIAGLFFPVSRSLCAPSKPLMVHYMPWFVAKPYSGSWGWHWTMNHFNPDVINASGEREIASWYYPLIGPYDSADPVVLEYHVLLMKLAGIDGIIVDWYGMDNYLDYGVNNQRTTALFNFIRKSGLKFSLCYEDRTIQQEISGGFISATGAIAHAQLTMLYAQSNYFTSCLRWSNQPVLLNFGPQYFKTNGQWQTIFSVLNATNQPAFFTLDNRIPAAIGAFNWPPMWLSQSSGGVLTIPALENYLTNFQQNAAFWPAFISSAFPRFHDIYAQAGVGSSYGTLNDNNGDTFRLTLSRALTNASAIVQVATWNDFGEGTIIEPTKQFGYRDLGIIQDFRRQYLEPGFACQTNDLALATRLLNLRRQYSTNSIISAELNRVFTNIVSGNLSAARLQLSSLESNRPAIYNLSAAGGVLEFSIGGYASASGAQVQATSNLASPSWTTVTSFPASTDLMRFSTPVSTQGPPAFFKVRTMVP
jgi:hypothetical protein